MVVVEVAEQHDVDVVDVLVHGQVAAPAQGPETAAEEGVGEDAQAPPISSSTVEWPSQVARTPVAP